MKRQLLLYLLSVLSMTAMGMTVPVTLTFDSQEDFDQWTTIDVNNDGSPYRWEYNASDKVATYTENKTSAANDWLISPMLELKAGHAYKIVFNLRKNTTYSSDKEYFTINVGGEPSVAGMESQLYKTEAFTSSYYTDVETKYSPQSDGEYHIGLHIYTKSYSGGLDVKSVKIEEILPLPMGITNLKAVAAPQGEMQCDLTWTWPTKNDAGGNLSALTGANVYRGTSSYFTVNDASLIGTAEGGLPGEQGSFADNIVPSAGRYYYKVVPFDANGFSVQSASSAQSDYIGKATSLSNVKNVKATLAEGTEKTIHLTWEPPTASEGYLELSEVKYKITRKGVINTTSVTLETAWDGEQPYVDEVSGTDSYTYTVYTVYNGSTAFSGTNSNAVTVNAPLDLPYSESFSSSSALQFYTLFHGASCTRDWGISSSALNFWGGSSADAWAVTPKFNMKAGKAYKITFNTKVSKAASPKDLYVYYGQQPTADGLQENQIFYETINSIYYTGKTIIMSVPYDGTWHIAFRCYGKTDSNDLYVDDLKIEEIATVPLEVSNLAAEVAPLGELKATLSWTNPTLSNAGTELSNISKVIVKREGETVAELSENVLPGAEMKYEDIVPEAGKYTYSVSVADGDAESLSVSVETGWIGMDVPVRPENPEVALDAAGFPVISFDKVTGGVNDGYVGEVTYTITRNDEVIAEKIEQTSYTDSTPDLSLAKYVYGVKASNSAGESELAKAEGIVLGDAIMPPYSPDFTDASSFDIWTFGHEQGQTSSWKHSSDKLQGSKSGDWAFTPKMILYPGEYYVNAKFTCYSTRFAEDFEIWLCRNNDAENLDTVFKIADVHVESINFPDTQRFDFTMPDYGSTGNDDDADDDDSDGDEGEGGGDGPFRVKPRYANPYAYHIGYKLASGNMYGYIHQADLGVTVITGVEDVEASKAYISDGDLILSEGMRAEIFSVEGRKVASVKQNVNLDILAEGIYIIVAVDSNGKRTSMKYMR